MPHTTSRPNRPPRGSQHGRLLAVLLAILAGALGGCGSSGGGGPTRGWAVQMRVSETRTNRLEYFKLEPDGTLVYVAGIRAGATEPGDGTPTWRGTLTSEELAPILALLDANPDPEEVRSEPGIPNYKLALKRGGAMSRRYASGPTPFFEQLEAGLSGAVLARRTDELAPPDLVPAE